MKKVVSLLLVLAMVLTMVPFAFAEGEQETLKMIYDLGEAYAVSNEFLGEDMAVDYPQAGMTSATGNTGTWQVGRFVNNNGAYDRFSPFSKLYRYGPAGRAPEDKVNTTVNVGKNASGGAINANDHLITTIASMIWHDNNAVTLFDTNTLYHPHTGGAPSIYGDGGYGVNNNNGPAGSIGYSFGNGLMRANSATGYQNSNFAAHLSAIFTAPRAGLISPNLVLNASADDKIVYQLYNLDAAGNKTVIYPAAGEAMVSIEPTAVGLTVNDEWASGWYPLSTTTHTRSDDYVWVNAGDQLILRFAPIGQNGTNTSFCVDTVQYIYKTSASVNFSGGYLADDEAPTVDLRGLTPLPEELTTYTATEGSGLIATETNGVFTVTDSYSAGSTVVVNATAADATVAINVVLEAYRSEYDLSMAYEVTNTFTGTSMATDYPNQSLTPKYPNDGTSIWTVGYYTYISGYDTFTPYTILARYNARRAYNDDKNTTLDTSMIWGTHSFGVTSDGGYGITNPNNRVGSLGYNFGTELTTTGMSSATGWEGATGEHEAAVFTAPYAGVITPYVKLAAGDNNKIVFRLDKVAKDGTMTAVYPIISDTPVDITVVGGADPIEKWASGWKDIPKYDAGWTILDNGLIRVDKGDKLVLRFTSHGIAGSNTYILDTVKMIYRDDFGPNDELLLTSPIANYDKETVRYITVPGDTVDLTRVLLNPEAKGEVRYTVTGNKDVLRATATPGIYATTGVFNAGGEAAVVTAEYWSSNTEETEPLFTTSTNVYINAQSALSDTFAVAPNFKATALGLAHDGWMLPYYADAVERELYGTVDLGLTEVWKNATVSFDKDGYFEYLGNGRIRAIAKYDYTTAGGFKAANSPASGSFTAKRDQNTVGTPVIMTVTAADGGSAQFSLWSFNAQVSSGTVNAYTFSNAAPFANATITMEAVVADGTFKAMVPDSSNSSVLLTPIADEMYADRNRALYIQAGTWVFMDVAENYWKNYVAPTPYVDYDGFSTAFTAPRDGHIEVSTFLPVLGAAGSGSGTYASRVINSPFTHEIRVYDADGTYETMCTINYAANSDSTKLILFDSVTASSVGTNAVYNKNEMADDITDDTVTFAVEKGQIVRVLLTSKAQAGANNIQVSRTNLPMPTFTYVFDGTSEGDEAFTAEYGGGTAYGFVYVPGGSEMTEAGTLVVAYDVNGNVVGTATVATNDSMIVDMDGTYGLVDVEMPTTAIPTYMKFFMWKDLENIQPLYGDITIH